MLLAKLASRYHLQTLLESSRILMRICDSFEGLDNRHVRFAVKNAQAISQLAVCLKELSQNLCTELEFSSSRQVNLIQAHCDTIAFEALQDNVII